MVSLAELVKPRPLAEQAEQVEIHMADGIYIRQILIPKSDSLVPQHSHAWDHLTMLARGAIYVWKDGVLDKQYRAPTAVMIKAGVKHLFLTLEDNTLLYCIHSMHDGEAAKVLEEHQLTIEDVGGLRT